MDPLVKKIVEIIKSCGYYADLKKILLQIKNENFVPVRDRARFLYVCLEIDVKKAMRKLSELYNTSDNEIDNLLCQAFSAIPEFNTPEFKSLQY